MGLNAMPFDTNRTKEVMKSITILFKCPFVSQNGNNTAIMDDVEIESTFPKMFFFIKKKYTTKATVGNLSKNIDGQKHSKLNNGVNN